MQRTLKLAALVRKMDIGLNFRVHKCSIFLKVGSLHHFHFEFQWHKALFDTIFEFLTLVSTAGLLSTQLQRVKSYVGKIYF